MRSFLATLLLGPSLACSTLASDVVTAEADHTEGEPTFAQHQWLWADDSLAEYMSVSKWVPAAFLPTDHPMTQRLQYWVDRMDDALRAAYPTALEATPRPRVAIVKDKAQKNALTAGVPITWHVPTRRSRASSEGAKARVIEIRPTGTADPIKSTSKQPIEREHGPSDLAEFLKFHNESFATCRLSLEADTVVIGDGCGAPPSGTTSERSDRLAFYASSKWITITTGFLLQSQHDEEHEEHIVATIAHELGHYYRAHITLPTDAFNYFYALGDANLPHRPTPDARYLEQTRVVRAKLRNRGQANSFSEENRLMVDQKLGFYTIEQEADELSLEILAMIGLSPTLGLDAASADFKAYGVDSGLTWEQCSALRARGFKDEDGQPVSVPVGNITVPHHSYCFRIFNMAREIEAHHYEVAISTTRPSENWSDLIALVDHEGCRWGKC